MTRGEPFRPTCPKCGRKCPPKAEWCVKCGTFLLIMPRAEYEQHLRRMRMRRRFAA